MWFNDGNKKNIDICKNMDDSQNKYVRWEKTITHRHTKIYCIVIYK